MNILVSNNPNSPELLTLCDNILHPHKSCSTMLSLKIDKSKYQNCAYLLIKATRSLSHKEVKRIGKKEMKEKDTQLFYHKLVNLHHLNFPMKLTNAQSSSLDSPSLCNTFYPPPCCDISNNWISLSSKNHICFQTFTYSSLSNNIQMK